MAYKGDAGFYGQIELAINTTGTAGVQALGKDMQDARAKLAAFQSQLQAGGPITAQQVAEAGKLAGAFEKATEAFAAGQRVLAGQSAALKDTGSSAQGASRAILDFSRAAEDFTTGGFLGVVNNVPGVFRGIGQAAKLTTPQIMALETAASLTATAGFALYKNWGSVQKLWADGTGPKLLPDLKELSAQLDALKEKKLPSLIDQQDIKILEREVQLLERRKAAQSAQSGQTEDQKKSGEIFNKGVVEATGGDRSKLVDAIVAARGGPAESADVKAIREKIAATRASAAEPGTNSDVAKALLAEAQHLESTALGQQAAGRARMIQGVNDLINDAGNGDEKSQGEVGRYLDQFRPKFDAKGVDAGKLGKAITQASRKELGYERDRKDVEEAAAESAAETEKRVREAIHLVKDRVEDGLEDSIQSALKGGAKRDEATAGVRAGLLNTLRKQGVSGYDTSEVADQLIKAAADKAEHNIRDGADSALGRRQAAATQDAKGADERAGNAARQEAERKRARLEAEAKQVAPGYIDKAEARFAANAAARLDGAQVVRTRRQRDHAIAFGQPFAYADNDLEGIVGNDISQGLRRSGQDPRLGPIIARQAREKTGDDAARNFGQLGNGVAAMQGVVGQTQSHIGQVQGQLGKILGRVNALERNNGHLAQGNRQLANRAQRTQQRRPSLLTEGDNW